MKQNLTQTKGCRGLNNIRDKIKGISTGASYDGCGPQGLIDLSGRFNLNSCLPAAACRWLCSFKRLPKKLLYQSERFELSQKYIFHQLLSSLLVYFFPPSLPHNTHTQTLWELAATVA